MTLPHGVSDIDVQAYKLAKYRHEVVGLKDGQTLSHLIHWHLLVQDQ